VLHADRGNVVAALFERRLLACCARRGYVTTMQAEPRRRGRIMG
jgi:hypothetical protein